MLDKQQITAHFVGRSQEIHIFEHWLQDPKAPWILYFYDALEARERKGGVGKTWLLRQCASIARQCYSSMVIITIDFFNIADRDGFTIVKRVVEGLKATYPEWSPTAFTTAIEQQSIAEYPNTKNPTSYDVANFLIRDKLYTALVSDLRNLNEQLEYKNKSLLIFFDTFEAIEQDLSIAVLSLSQRFPDNYQFERMGVVIAGRNVIDWNQTNWQGRQHEVQSVPIFPFKYEEMMQYLGSTLNYKIYIDPEQVQVLYELTEGRPVVVGLATDILNERILSPRELTALPKKLFEASLVAKINELEHPLNIIILFMAHLYHRFNLSMLEWILQEGFRDFDFDLQGSVLLEQVASLSFVRLSSTGESFALHDEMLPLLNKYCWEFQDPDGRARRSISQTMIPYYEREITQTQDEQERQVYILEKLYHQLSLNLDEGLHSFYQHFEQAIRSWNSTFARLLILEAQNFGPLMSRIQRDEMRLAQAKLQFVEKDAAAARFVIFEGLAKLKGMELQQGRVDKPKMLEIFYSYANEDTKLVEQLQKHLAVLKQRHFITDWHKDKIVPGDDVAEQMRHLNTAHIILLCISPYFMASDSFTVEATRALERHKAKEAVVIPILLRPTGNWKDALFGNLQAIPRNSKAVTIWSNRDVAFDKIAYEIREVIERLRKTTFWKDPSEG